MTHFPVTCSTLSADHLAFLIKDTYNLKSGTSCKLLKTGINHSYLIEEAEQKYIFRVYSLNWRSRLEINEELRLLNLLKDGGISVSYPIAAENGEYINEIPAPEGMRYGVLFSFANGEKHLNFPADLHFKVGQTMAGIHQITQHLELQRTTYTPKVVLQDPMQHLSKYLPAATSEMDWMLSTQKHLLAAIQKADTTGIRTGAVHMDIWFDNFNITKDGQVTIFDFDFCGNGWLCYDIAYYVLQLHSTEKDPAERDAKLKSFIDGYESVTPISAEEKRLLPLLGVSLYFLYLGIQCARFENWSNVFLNETYLKRFINLLVKKYFDEQVAPFNLPA